jgi:nucleoside-diphosphate-sugar epimerase
MNQAVITGSTGFIGSVLVSQLLNAGIPVIALGRKTWDQVDPLRLQRHPLLTYITLTMEKISNLSSVLKDHDCKISDKCVFYNLAWGGQSKLSDLDPITQMTNVSWSLDALDAAANIGCSKFVHIGTMEEAFTLKYLDLDYHCHSYYNRHVIYSLAKITSRNALKAKASEYSIDLMFASNSHVMGPNDDKDSFLQVTLLKLVNSEPLIFSTGEQMFDVVTVSDCARGYCLIGHKGNPGSEYWVGSGEARPLKEYVEIMAKIYPSKQPLQFGKMPYNDISLLKDDFSIDNLVEDTGYKPEQSYEEAVVELHNWLVNKNDPTRSFVK